MMCKIYLPVVPLRRAFSLKEKIYIHFRTVYAWTTLKQKCSSVYGVKLWNYLNDEQNGV